MEKNLKLKKISFTGYTSLRCPVKYYFTYLYPKTSITDRTIIGTIVHEIYENLTKRILKLKNPDCSKLIKKELDDQNLLNITNEAIQSYEKRNVTIEPFDINDILKEIPQHISLKFMEYLKSKKEEGSEILIENIKLTDTFKFMNETIQMYSRPDITILSKDSISIFDIKTGRDFNEDYKLQLMIYLYVYNKELPTSTKKDILKGTIFFTRYNKLYPIVWTNNKDVLKTISNAIKRIDKLYKKLEIKNIKEIKTFTENLPKKKKNELSEISDAIFEGSHKTVICKYCPVKNFCPIYDKKQNKRFKYETEQNKNDEELVFLNTKTEKADEIIVNITV